MFVVPSMNLRDVANHNEQHFLAINFFRKCEILLVIKTLLSSLDNGLYCTKAKAKARRIPDSSSRSTDHVLGKGDRIQDAEICIEQEMSGYTEYRILQVTGHGLH